MEKIGLIIDEGSHEQFLEYLFVHVIASGTSWVFAQSEKREQDDIIKDNSSGSLCLEKRVVSMYIWARYR